MNDQQFIERAHANPHDDSADFLAAAASSPERQKLLEEVKRFDASLKQGLAAVAAPPGLKQALLAIPEGVLHPDTAVAAANDPAWRRGFQYAAGLFIAIAALALVFRQPPPAVADPLGDKVFTHIYSEIEFLDDVSPLTLAQVNAIMDTYAGTVFLASADMDNLTINVTKDCWVDFQNEVRGVHLVITGERGPVTVMVLTNTPVAGEVAIADDRFNGMISPMSGGNLVVVGEKDEAIRRYSTLLAANINW